MAYRKGESTMEGNKKLYFPEGALLNQMEVAVVESERRKSEILKEPFVVYLVESRYCYLYFFISFSNNLAKEGIFKYVGRVFHPISCG